MSSFFYILFAVAVIFLLLRYLALRKILSKYDIIKFKDTEHNSPALQTINGCGMCFRGKFRNKGSFYATYHFWCFLWLPIFSKGCYLVKYNGDNRWEIYGEVEGKSIEVCAIYLQWYGWAGLLVSLLSFLGYFINM